MDGFNVEYCVYKGLSHIKEDFVGDKGDIDIYVPSDSLKSFDTIASAAGFLRVERPSKMNVYYQGYDIATGRGVLLDVVSSFVLERISGSYIYKPSRQDLSTRSISLEGVVVKALSEADSVVIQLLTASFLSSEKKITAFRSVFQTISESEFDSSKLKSLFFNKLCFSKCLIFLSTCHNKKDLKIFLDDECICPSHLGSKRKLSKFSEGYLELCRLIGRFFGRPQYKVCKGKIFAVVGVDGSGKSTVVEDLERSDFFKRIGVSRIYFGANEFLIPGLLRAYNVSCSRRYLLPVKVATVFLMFVERHIRLFKAIYLRSQGNIVICDRYFYDDEVYRVNFGLEKRNQVIDGLRSFFLARVRLVPDRTFFLDVSPAVAYQRKQDFSYEKMLKINSLYRTYMRTRREVLVVDADLPREEVRLIIHGEILNQLKSKSL